MTAQEIIENSRVPMSVEEYIAESEDRKVITPENVKGLIDYPALFHAMQSDRELRPALSVSVQASRVFSDFISSSAEDFLAKYTVSDGPINPRTDKPYGVETKAYVEWAASQDKTPVSTAQYNLLGSMLTAYRTHAAIEKLSSEGYTCIKDVVLRADVFTVPCMCRFNEVYVRDNEAVCVRVITSSDLNTLRNNLRTIYTPQLAVMRYTAEALGLTVTPTIAVIERSKLPRCAVIQNVLSDSAISKLERERIEKHIAAYAESRAKGVYGTRFEKIILA